MLIYLNLYDLKTGRIRHILHGGRELKGYSFQMSFRFYFQIHVIKPVLPKLNNVFEYAVSEENGNSYFYFYFFIVL